MNVSELRELLEDLPGDMEVFIPVGEEALVSACYSQSEVCGTEIPGEPPRDIFLIMPCTCNHDELPIDLETHLN